MFSVGIDMGGTFTDGYFSDGTQATVCKIPTTHFDLSQSVMGCLQRGGESFGLDLEELLDQMSVLRLATTIGTNSVVEGTGDAIGVMVDTGATSSLYGPIEPSPAIGPFVRADQIVGVGAAASTEEILAQCRELVLGGVRQVVVSFPLARGTGEVQLRELVRDRYPAHYLRSIPLTVGSEVANIEDDELRTTTTILNAYVSRPMAKLMYRTEGLLQQAGLRVPLLAVHSDVSCGRVARTTAISTYSSGPAAGLSLVADLAQANGDPIVLGFDMGGTTLDLGLAREGAYVVEQTPQIRGVRVSLPVPGIISVGLGGSSIASVDESNAVVVGPESAGAVPGPACFARGGSNPTLTDADLVLGYLTAGQELTTDITLDEQAAMTALATIGDDPLDAARRVRAAAHGKAAASIAALLADAGVASVDVALYAFGGAGPLHAGAVAELAGIPRVRSFPYGGVFSARGVAGSSIDQTYEQSITSSDTAHDVILNLVHRALLDLSAEHLASDTAQFVADLTDNTGQHRSCRLADPGDLDAVTSALGPVDDIVRVSLRTSVPAPPVPAIELDSGAPSEDHLVWWTQEGESTPEIDVADLPHDASIPGPMLVNVSGATHAIPPGWTCRRNDSADLLWERSE